MIEELDTQAQIRKYINDFKKDENLDFINKLGCNDPDGMCNEYNSNKKNNKKIYQHLPKPFPKKEAKFIFISKEPSVAWADTQGNAYQKAYEYKFMGFISGFIKKSKKTGEFVKDKNGKYKLTGIGDIAIMMMAFLNVFGEKSSYLTDMSKCAMSVIDADRMNHLNIDGKSLKHRYECCNPFLKWELEKLAVKDPVIFLVGKNYYFDYWDKKSKDEIKFDISFEKRYFKEIVGCNTNKIYSIPHYSIQFSCPDFILNLLNSKSRVEKAEKIISKERVPLLEYYLKNFDLSKYVIDDINNSIKIIKNSRIDFKVTPSQTLLYLIYENEFAKIKT